MTCSSTTQPHPHHRLDSDSPCPTTATAPAKPRRVRFGTVQTRLYLCSLGDHPWVASGVPVGITDQYVELATVDLSSSGGGAAAVAAATGHQAVHCRRHLCRALTPEERCVSTCGLFFFFFCQTELN